MHITVEAGCACITLIPTEYLCKQQHGASSMFIVIAGRVDQKSLGHGPVLSAGEPSPRYLLQLLLIFEPEL